MPEISNIELYHKGINEKRYPELFIKVIFDGPNFFYDDFCSPLTEYFTNNLQPFNTQKSYDISIYCEYGFDDRGEGVFNFIEKELNSRAEVIRNCLTPIIGNIRYIFVYGKIELDKYSTVFEIAENDFSSDKEIYVLTDSNVYNNLRYYYERNLMEQYLKSDSVNEKQKKKIYKSFKSNFYKESKLNEQILEKYKWLISFFEMGGEISIRDRMENSVTSFSAEYNMWVHSTFAKFRDQYVYDSINSISHTDYKQPQKGNKQKLTIRKAIGKYEKSLSDAYEEWEYSNSPINIQAKQLGLPENSSLNHIHRAFIEYTLKSDYFNRKSKYEPEVIYNNLEDTFDGNKKN